MGGEALQQAGDGEESGQNWCLGMVTALLAHATLQVCQGPSLSGTARASPQPAPAVGCTARGCSALGPCQDRASRHPGTRVSPRILTAR